VENCDVIAIDEIGPMELFSEKFKEAVRKTLESRRLVIAIVHWKAQDVLISEARKREDAEIITVTYENREKLHEAIVEKALKILKQI
jgi:nucleoside-triphosphatase